MARYEHLPIYKDAYDLLRKVMETTQTFPKDYRYSLGGHMHDACIRLLKLVYITNTARDKVECLRVMLQCIVEIGVFLRIAHDLKIIANNRFYELIELRDSLEKQTTGWLRSFDKLRPESNSLISD